MSKIKELIDDTQYTEIDFSDVEYQEYLEDIYTKSLQDLNATIAENKNECKDCVNDYDDPQMCKLCINGSHKTLGQ